MTRPGPRVVDLWWIGPHTRLGRAECLSPDERARARGLTHQATRADFVRHRAALRTVLAEYLGVRPARVRFSYGPAGKPGCGGPQFSLSHAGEWALIAVGGHEVETLGVDLEWTRQHVDAAGLARRFLPGLDLEAIAPAGRRAAFFAAWTGYEARLKAAGSGLGRALPPDSETWPARRLAAPADYAATLVTPRPLDAVRCRLPARDAATRGRTVVPGGSPRAGRVRPL